MVRNGPQQLSSSIEMLSSVVYFPSTSTNATVPLLSLVRIFKEKKFKDTVLKNSCLSNSAID
jgi:hypothetical protein